MKEELGLNDSIHLVAPKLDRYSNQSNVENVLLGFEPISLATWLVEQLRLRPHGYSRARQDLDYHWSFGLCKFINWWRGLSINDQGKIYT